MFISMMNLFFIINLVITLVIACSSNSWALCWLMMEVNVMMFIPILSFDSNKLNNSNSIKYFLAQAMGSLIMLITLMIWMPKGYLSALNSKDSLMAISMAIKSGIPPFHFWFPQLLEDSNFVQSLMLLTSQKVIPLTFLSYSVSDTFIAFILVSSLVGASGGFNQNSVLKILAYSSMIHSAWLMMSMLSSLLVSFVYFLSYSVITFLNLLIFKKMMVKKISQISNLSIPLMFKLAVSLNLMSLGGMPPFLGFLNKLVVISFITITKSMLIMTTLVFSSLVSLFYYTRILYSILVGNSFAMKAKLSHDDSKSVIQLIFMSIMVNLMFPLLIIIL